MVTFTVRADLRRNLRLWDTTASDYTTVFDVMEELLAPEVNTFILSGTGDNFFPEEEFFKGGAFTVRVKENAGTNIFVYNVTLAARTFDISDPDAVAAVIVERMEYLLNACRAAEYTESGTYTVS